MQLKIEQMDAWQVLHALGIEIKEEGERNYVFVDPELPGMRFRVDQGGIVELTDTGTFVAGSILDFLAFRVKSYEAALDYLICTYGNLLTGNSYSPELYRDATIQEASSRRAKFMGIIKLRGNIVSDPQLATVNMWLVRQGLNPMAIAPFVIGFPGSYITTFINGKFDTKGTYVCFPYMRNPWTVAAWRVVDVRTGGEQWVEVERCRTSFFGMLGTSWIESRVFLKDLEVCRVYSAEFAHQEKLRGVVCIRQLNASDYNNYRLPVGIVQSSQSLVNIILCRRNFQTLLAQPPEGKPIPSQAYVTGRLASLLAKDTVDPAVNEVLTFIRHESDLVVGLQNDLRNAGHPRLADRIQALLDQHRTYRLEKYEIQERPTGLVAIRGDDAIALTNFLIHIDYMLTFIRDQKLTEIFYVGRIIFEGRAFPVSLRKVDVSKVQVIEQLAQAVVGETIQDSATKLPCVIDSTHGKLIRAVVNTQIAEVIGRRGVGHLGWNGLDSFETPGWIIRTSGVQASSRIPHPGCRHFNQLCFFTEIPALDLKVEVPPAVHTAIALVVAQMLRAYLKAPCGVLDIHNGKETLEIMTAVLMGLEQRAPLHITTSTGDGVKRSFDSMHGFPCLVTCATPDMLRTVDYGCFLPTAGGAIIGAVLSPEQKMQTVWLARNIFHKVIQGFLRTRGTSHQLLTRGIPNYPVLLREGQAAVERYTEYRSNYLLSNDTPQLFEILLRCAPHDPSRLFKFSLAEQAAIVFVRTMGKGRNTIIGELQAVGLNPRPYGAKNLLVDAEKLTTLLSEFYGRPIKLRTEDAAEDTEEPGQDDVSGLSQVGQS